MAKEGEPTRHSVTGKREGARHSEVLWSSWCDGLLEASPLRGQGRLLPGPAQMPCQASPCMEGVSTGVAAGLALSLLYLSLLGSGTPPSVTSKAWQVS